MVKIFQNNRKEVLQKFIYPFKCKIFFTIKVKLLIKKKLNKIMIKFWVDVRMTQRQNYTVRHFGTMGHFGTATK